MAACFFGKTIRWTAGKFIRYLSYPESDIDIIFELEIEKGWHTITNKNIDKIMYCKRNPPDSLFKNMVEIDD